MAKNTRDSIGKSIINYGSRAATSIAFLMQLAFARDAGATGLAEGEQDDTGYEPNQVTRIDGAQSSAISRKSPLRPLGGTKTSELYPIIHEGGSNKLYDCSALPANCAITPSIFWNGPQDGTMNYALAGTPDNHNIFNTGIGTLVLSEAQAATFQDLAIDLPPREASGIRPMALYLGKKGANSKQQVLHINVNEKKYPTMRMIEKVVVALNTGEIVEVSPRGDGFNTAGKTDSQVGAMYEDFFLEVIANLQDLQQSREKAGKPLSSVPLAPEVWELVKKDVAKRLGFQLVNAPDQGQGLDNQVVDEALNGKTERVNPARVTYRNHWVSEDGTAKNARPKTGQDSIDGVKTAVERVKESQQNGGKARL